MPPPPPPPPPPPKAPVASQPVSAAPPPASGGASALFAEIRQKGDAIAGGLRHVTDDQKVYKQKRDVQPVSFEDLERRKAEIEAAKRAKLETDVSAAKGGTAAAPIMHLEGSTWTVANQVAAALTISAAQPSHIVSIKHCTDVKIVVDVDIASLSVSNSDRVSIQLRSVLDSCRITDCEKIDIGVAGALPLASLHDSSSINLYLTDPKRSRETRIITASCATVNVNVPDAADASEIIEVPLPEQFVSRVVQGADQTYKVVTVPSRI